MESYWDQFIPKPDEVVCHLHSDQHIGAYVSVDWNQCELDQICSYWVVDWSLCGLVRGPELFFLLLLFLVASPSSCSSQFVCPGC